MVEEVVVFNKDLVLHRNNTVVVGISSSMEVVVVLPSNMVEEVADFSSRMVEVAALLSNMVVVVLSSMEVADFSSSMVEVALSNMVVVVSSMVEVDILSSTEHLVDMPSKASNDRLDSEERPQVVADTAGNNLGKAGTPLGSSE